MADEYTLSGETPMRSRVLVLSVPALVLVAGCSTATKQELPASAPVAESSGSPSAVSTSTLDRPVEEIAATPSGCAVLDKDFPGMRQHPMYAYFKTMTLNQLAALSKGQITREMMARAQVDLAALNKASAAPTPVTASLH